LVLGDASFEKILLFPQEDHFIKPGKWIIFSVESLEGPREDRRRSTLNADYIHFLRKAFYAASL